MDVVVHAYSIPSIGRLTEAKKNNQERLELDMYFNELMHIAINIDMAINTDIIH